MYMPGLSFHEPSHGSSSRSRTTEYLTLVGATLPGVLDPAIPIAAIRAGGRGALNLEWIADAEAARAALGRLAYRVERDAGVILSTASRDHWPVVLADLPRAVDFIVLAVGNADDLEDALALLRPLERSIWIEVTSLDAARRAMALGADGLVCKGHEAGGPVGDTSTFVLLQQIVAATTLPVWVHGGVGVHSAAACAVGGAQGAILDSTLALARESTLPSDARQIIATMDGSETITVGTDLDDAVRVFQRPGNRAVAQLRATGAALANEGDRAAARRAWREAIGRGIGWENDSTCVWVLGQDAAFAAPLARRFVTVAGIFAAMEAAIPAHLHAAQDARPLDADAPLARSHGTRYPLVQGPMTRVSDTAAFANDVAEAGGLPFLALALLRAPDVERLLGETQTLLGDRPWGVGILGFVPLELRQEQLAVVRRFKPPFAIIAGGRPDQANELEREGIPTYLHVPSPGLLRMFVRDGARRFIFEGRECGGHVGPRSSFVLWDSMVDVLREELSAAEAARCQVLFAGGIHDARSAAMVAALAGPLLERGTQIGVLMGTAYLFTEEAVRSGAILPQFQREAIACERTLLVESGPGHAIRCAPTPFGATFEATRRRLQAAGHAPDAVREHLEDMNMGRLRIASKGIMRHPDHGKQPDAPQWLTLDEGAQHEQGMYMIGQVATLRHATTTVAALHQEVALGGAAWLQALASEPERVTAETPSDIAIIGMSCMLPQAPDLGAYWHNILNKVDAVGEVPADRWDWQRHYDPDRRARDKIYSRWGGFLDDVAFNPMDYGIPPASLRSIEPVQLLALEAVRAALYDAGYAHRPFARATTSVILGAGGGAGALGEQYAIRSALPDLLEDVPEELLDQLPEWTEDSFPGILLNVIAGRIANRFDLRGLNYTVDAACASSLAAVYQAVRELESGTSDVVISGGLDNVQNPFGFLCFSKTQALSPRGRSRPFDDSADGIAISEGVVIVVLKRLADAERDGDRVYAVIKGIAGSSDGRDRSLTAPRPEGQAVALQRAYRKANIDPTTVGLIEAHGTGTVVGDASEIASLKGVWQAAGAAPQGCAIGSVKSMIGHTKCAAGVAGLVKAALALHHKVLPPTLGVETPSVRAAFDTSPFYVNTETRPWIAAPDGTPRRAGVSAFGFGGTNFHAVLEEWDGALLPPQPLTEQHASQVFLWAAPSDAALRAELAALEPVLAARPALHALAQTLHRAWRRAGDDTRRRLAIVAGSVDQLAAKVATVRAALDVPDAAPFEADGVYLGGHGAKERPTLAFLFPGQGSQYPDMLRDFAVAFPSVRATFERADAATRAPISPSIFPRPAFDDAARAEQARALTQTDVAQPALGAAGIALHQVLGACGVRPDMVAGHSYGEYVALCAAGALPERALIALSEARGRAIVESARDDMGTMAAVRAAPDTIAPLLAGIPDVWLANLNAPQQTMISGTSAGIAAAVARLTAAGIGAQPIAVACAFHSPLVAPAQALLADALGRTPFAAPHTPVYSNTTAAPYPADGAAVADLLAAHLVEPVRFVEQIQAMAEAGARVFVEVGPRNVLTGLVRKIVGDRAVVALATDVPGRSAVVQLQHTLASLAVRGVAVRLDPFWGDVEPATLAALAQRPALAPTTWWVNGGQSRPMAQPAAPVHRPVALVRRAEPTSRPPAEVVHAANGHGQNGTFATANGHEQNGAHALNGHAPNGARPVVASSPAVAPVPVVAPSASPVVAHRPLVPGTADVVGQFQDMLQHFLRTQQAVMQQYLQPAPLAPTPVVQTPMLAAPPAPVVEAAMAPMPPAVDVVAARTRPPAERWELAAVEHPLPAARRPLPADEVVVITDDEGGIADTLAGLLRAQGTRAVVVRERGVAARVAPDVYHAPLATTPDARAFAATVEREHGAVGALVHLLPLRAAPSFGDMDLAAVRGRIALETGTLFGLVQAFGPALRRDADGARAVVGATAMGGTWGSTDGADFLPTQGAVAGFLKSLAAEWPDVRVRAVDFERADDAIARRLLQELVVVDAEREVGYPAGRRVVLRPVAARSTPTVAAPLDHDCVVVITGGARGITAEIARDLARRYAPTLLLLGRSPLPPDTEAADTVGLVSMRDLKAALIERRRAANQPVTPPLVDADYAHLLNEREMRANLAAMRAHGARVAYHSLDVRDEAAMRSFIATVYASFGRIDGVIHGAGIIEDKLVADKSEASFERVVGTKVDSASVLIQALRPDGLRFVLFFGSVAGRWGNRGQADYAAANEVLNKLACWLDRRWAARVVAINWGPWAKHGMVNAELERQFAERGLALLDSTDGQRLLDQELRRTGAPEVVVAAGAHAWAAPSAGLPLVRGVERRTLPDGVDVVRSFDPKDDRYLRDHMLDGKPVVPFAVVLELIAEVVQSHWPDQRVVAVHDMRLFSGIVLHDVPRLVLVRARRVNDGRAAVEVADPEGQGRPLYQAEVELAATEPAAPAFVPPRLDGALRGTVADAYERWLFHGPLFQAIDAVGGLSPEGITGTLVPSAAERCVAGATGRWLIDPVVFDAALQLIIIWTRTHLDMTPLPARFRSYRRWGAAPRTPVAAYVSIVREGASPFFTADIAFVDDQGGLVGLLEGMECPSSKALNRLAHRQQRDILTA